MRVIQLKCSSRSELYDFLQQEFPSLYGRNLDALHDVLGAMTQDLTLELDETALCAALGDRYFDNLLRMLRDTASENPQLEICLK